MFKNFILYIIRYTRSKIHKNVRYCPIDWAICDYKGYCIDCYKLTVKLGQAKTSPFHLGV